MNENDQNNKPSKLVDFLLVGAQKSGTTTLHSYLNDHPQIQMASKKEVHFFNNNQFFLNPERDYDFYHSWFDFDDTSKLRGEVTPAYLYCRDAAVRIWQYNPAMKIVIIIRDPIERAFSHWNMEFNRDAESLSFNEALLKESERCREALPLQHYVYSYIDRGFYSSQIREYWRCFGKKQILVLKYDHLRENLALVLKELFDFLEIDGALVSDFASHKKVLHKAKYAGSMDRSSSELLLKCYKYEVLQLENMLGWDCSRWLKR